MYFLLLIYTCTSVFDLLKTFTFLFVKVNTTAYFHLEKKLTVWTCSTIRMSRLAQKKVFTMPFKDVMPLCFMYRCFISTCTASQTD